VKLLLDNFSTDDNEKLVEYLLKEDETFKRTALYIAALDNNKTIGHLLLNAFATEA
jgi:ankyrin repeat protein